MGKGKPHIPCFVCFFKPTLLLGCIGLTPFVCSCRHTNNPSDIKYTTSPTLRFFSAIVCIAVILTLIDSIREFIVTKLNRVDKYLMINDIGLCMCATFLFIGGFLQTSQKKVELQSLAEVIEHAEKRGIVFLDSKFVKTNLHFLYGGIAFITILQITVTIRFFMQGDFDISSVRFFVSDTIYLLQVILAIHYHNIEIVFPCCFKRLSMQVKFALRQRLDNNYILIDDIPLTLAEERECLKYYLKQSLEKQLIELRRIYSSIFYCYKETEKFMNPSFVVWWVTIAFSFTIKQIVLIKCLQYNVEFGLPYVLSIIRPYIFISTTTIYLVIVEVTTNVVSYYTALIHYLYLNLLRLE